MITNSLFPIEHFAKKETPAENTFRQDNLELLKSYQAAVKYAFEMLHTKVYTIIKPHAMDRNMPAVALSSFIREYFINNMPFNCKDATKGRFKLTTNTGEYIYLKRLYDDLMPSNIETIENDLIINQCVKPGETCKANIFLGYTTEGGYPNPTGIYAVCIRGEKKEWWFDIAAAIEENTNSLYVKFKADQGQPKLKEGVIKIKRAKGE